MRVTKLGSTESKSPANLQQGEKAQESFGVTALTHCFVDADGNVAVGAGRARRKAFGVSALIQFCTLMALLMVPLFATGSRLILRPTNFVPLPPYGGAPRQLAANAQRPSLPPNHGPRPQFQFPQIQILTPRPTNTREIVDRDPTNGADFPPTIIGFQGVGNGPVGEPNIIPGFGERFSSQPPRPEPTPVPQPPKPIVVSQGVELAKLIRRVEPIYPMFAKQTHREGTVELRATISIDGTVRDLQVLSGDPVLARAASDAVTQWRFRPTLLSGNPVEVISFFTVNFHIDH